MHDIARFAETTLRASPHPALRLGELADILADRVDHRLTSPLLRTILEHHPERFRILESLGRWHATPVGRRRDDPGRAWVVAVADPDGPPDTPPSAHRLRESVRWLARGVDGRSRLEVSRWYAIALSERDVRAAMLRRAAAEAGEAA